MNTEQLRAIDTAKRHNLLVAAQKLVKDDLVDIMLYGNKAFRELKEAVEALDVGATADG